MTDRPTIPAPGNGPWRILILDRDVEDPKWIIATVAIPTDVRPAALDSAARYGDWDQVTEWVRAQTGFQASLIPVADALAWTIANGTAGDARVVPSVYAQFGQRWAITASPEGAWLAERRTGSAIRVVAADSQVELIGKLTAVEAEPTG